MQLSEKFVKKYMRMAKQVGEDQNPCYSRQLGVVLVKVYPDGDSRVVATGYNGPPKHTPHCDSRDYLEDIFWTQLTREERTKACNYFEIGLDGWEAIRRDSFLKKATGCRTCPRKIIGAKSGERTELCSCEHAERNAIYNATEDLHGCWAFCWCGVACWDCTKALINNGIKRCFFIEDASYARNGGTDYSFGSRWLFQRACVEIVLHKPDFYLT